MSGKGKSIVFTPREQAEIDALCRPPLDKEPRTLFDMQNLRTIARWHALQDPSLIPVEEVEKKSRQELCELLGIKFAKTDIPYETVLDSVESIPSWAWESADQTLMLNPYATSSGRSHSLHTLKNLRTLTDPDTRVIITGGYTKTGTCVRQSKSGFSLVLVLRWKSCCSPR